MIIDRFLAGVLSTILVEFALITIYAIIQNRRNKK